MMKLKLLYLGLAIFILASCKKEYKPLLDSPDKRLTDTLNTYQQILAQQGNAWQLKFLTKNGDFYNFVIKFDTENRVKMLADVNEKTAVNYLESGYRLEALLRPSVIFDTYNYLHLLSDPEPSVNNGDRGLGSKADFSFSMLSHKADTVNLYGNYNKNYAKLVKINANQLQQIENGGWKKSIQDFKSFYAAVQYPYIEFNNTQLLINIDTTQRKIAFSTFENQKLGASTDVSYAYDVNVINFSKPITIKNNKIDQLIWDESVGNYYVTISGTNYYIKNYTEYPININDLFGFGKKYAFLKIPSNKLDYGFTSDFNTAWQQSLDLLKASGRTIVNARFGFLDADRFELLIAYGSADYFGDFSGSSQFNAQAIFNVTKNGNSYTLDQGAYAGNWLLHEARLKPIFDYFTNSTFTAKWATSPDVKYNKTLIVGLHKDNSQGKFVYGVAQ